MKDFLEHNSTESIIKSALVEDIGPADHTSLAIIPSHLRASAVCLIKDEGVLAGVALAEKIFHHVDPSLKVEIFISDGENVSSGDKAFQVDGSAQSILKAERVVLNFLQHMSGIATLTRQVVSALEDTHTRVLDTRKTTPLIRHMEKWAVCIGGGVNHRFGLYDVVMIKDNHIDVAGGIKEALDATHDYLKNRQYTIPIIIETRNIQEVQEVLEIGGVHRILLDNMSTSDLEEAVKVINRQVPTEASGGITLDNVREVGMTGVDFVSMGALTHSAPHKDISLKIQ